MPLPDDVEPRMLDPEARKELRTLSREAADLVARHLVMTGQLLDEDPERALAHARAARALAGRVGVVREATGLAAYAAGEWSEALSELRAARRITGQAEHLGVAADCERAMGRPERALAYADDPDVPRLAQDQRVELVIVLAGARRDMGQVDAAVLLLQDPARRTSDKRPWAARLWYAYADALLVANRPAEARDWFGKAATVDVDGQTDAGDRLLELDGVVLPDPEDDDEDGDRDDLMSAEELAAYAQQVAVPEEVAVPEGVAVAEEVNVAVEPRLEPLEATAEATVEVAVEAEEAAEPEQEADRVNKTQVEGRRADDLDGPSLEAARPGVPQVVVEPAPEAPAPPRPTSPVAPPPFVAAPDEELRLFE